MTVARTMAARSYDPRLKVGAVLVPEDNTGILAQGYNGNYKGGPNEAESLEPGQSGMIHAEVNCLIKAPFHFSLKKHLYVTHSTCRQCAKLVVNANVARVVYGELYRDASGLDLLRSVGIEVMSLGEAIALARRA
jgi:dCMP deaminase